MNHSIELIWRGEHVEKLWAILGYNISLLQVLEAISTQTMGKKLEVQSFKQQEGIKLP